MPDNFDIRVVQSLETLKRKVSRLERFDVGSSGSSVTSISGSSVMSGTSGSVVIHNVSGVTSGSYNQVFVDNYGHVTSGSAISLLEGHIIEEEGTSLSQRSKLNFVGAGITATDDVGDNATKITIGDDILLETGDYIITEASYCLTL